MFIHLCPPVIELMTSYETAEQPKISLPTPFTNSPIEQSLIASCLNSIKFSSVLMLYHKPSQATGVRKRHYSRLRLSQ